jgi:hypothetical protein
MSWVYDDGGRAAAGFKGNAGDCVTRAVAIAAARPYREIYDLVNTLGRGERPPASTRRRSRSTARNGVHKPTMRKLLALLGWQWTPTMQIGQGCKVHLHAGELPAGRLIVSVSGHVCAVIDGVIHDTHDPSRAGKRCVYGYWRAREPTTPR